MLDEAEPTQAVQNIDTINSNTTIASRGYHTNTASSHAAAAVRGDDGYGISRRRGGVAPAKHLASAIGETAKNQFDLPEVVAWNERLMQYCEVILHILARIRPYQGMSVCFSIISIV